MFPSFILLPITFTDIWSSHALRMIRQYFHRGVFNADDDEARSQMHLASAYAGVGFGNAGCHLPHGISYAISGNVKPHIQAGGIAATFNRGVYLPARVSIAFVYAFELNYWLRAFKGTILFQNFKAHVFCIL